METDHAKICVYLDDGDNIPDSGDIKIACSSVITSSTNNVWGTGTFSSGSISEGSKYFIVSATDTASFYSYWTDTGTGRYYNGIGFYDNEPAIWELDGLPKTDNTVLMW